MSNGSNNPENTQATQTARSATAITVAGSDYELAGLSVAQGLEIYGKLPADYQKIADAYGQLAQRFQRPLNIALPQGMSFATAWENTIHSVRQTGGLDAAPDYQKKIYAQFKDQISAIPGVGSAVGAAETGASVIGAGAAGMRAGYDVLAFFPRALGSVRAIAREGFDAVGSAIAPIGDDQARAFGAAMAGATLYEGTVRQNMSTGSSLWNYPLQHLGAGFEWATLNIPGLSSVWPYVQACWQMVAQWASVKEGEPRKSFGEFVAENKAAAEQDRAGGQDSYHALFERRARSGELDGAAARMRQAEKVADIATVPIMDTAQNGGAIVTDQGTAAAVTRDRGNGPDITEGVGVAGQETRGQRMGQAVAAPFKPFADGLKGEHGFAYLAAGTAAAIPLGMAGKKYGPGMIEGAASAGRNLVHGAVTTARGAASGYLQGTADMLGGKPFIQAHSQLNGADALQARAQGALDRVKELEGHQPRNAVGEKLNKLRLSRAEARWEKIARKIDTLDEAMARGAHYSGGRMAETALKVSDKAAEIGGDAVAASRLGRVARGAGRIAPWLTVGFFAKDSFDGVQALSQGRGREASQSLASAGTVASGAAVGAGIGAFFGGVGAIPGALVGAGVAGAADFVGGLIGYGASDIAARTYDARHRAAAPSAATEQANLNQIAADPDIQQFCQAVQARDPQALRMLVGNSETAQNARLALKACGVTRQAGAWIAPDALPAAKGALPLRISKPSAAPVVSS